MVTKTHVLGVLLSAVVIGGAVGCGSASSPQPSTSSAAMPASSSSAATPPAQPTAAAGAQSCAALGGTVGPNQTCDVHSATPTYKLDMTFPLDYPDLQVVIDFLKQDRNDFIDWVTKFGLDGRGRPYEYVATAKTYQSGTPTAGTESLVLEIANDTGLANQGHPDTTFKAFNYDLTTHAPITFDTLFKPGTQPLEVLNPIVQRELVHGSDYRVNDLDAHAYQNFALTDDAVIFFFGQNQVVRDNNGPDQVSIPRTELASLLA